MLLGTLGAGLLGNMLTGKGVLRAGYGSKGEVIIRAGYRSNGFSWIFMDFRFQKIFDSTPSFNKL